MGEIGRPKPTTPCGSDNLFQNYTQWLSDPQGVVGEVWHPITTFPQTVYILPFIRPARGCIMGRVRGVGLYSFYFFDLDFMYKKKTLIKKNHPVRIIT